MTTNRHIRAVREATEAVAQAEQLMDLLLDAARENPDNCFIGQFLDKAEALVDEMSDDLDHHIEASVDAGVSMLEIGGY